MSRSLSFVLSLLLLVLLGGCQPEQPVTVATTGSVQLAVSTAQALSVTDISRVTVTSSAVDMPSISTELVKTDGVWGGVIGNIPTGRDWAFLAQAFDSAGTLRYEGRAQGITVMVGKVMLVTLTLQELSTETPYTNEAPLIDSVQASPVVVAPGESVTLVAHAHDPNLDDTLVYAWSAPTGSFASPSAASTTWSAPDTSGPVTLTLSVSDSHGAASSVSFTVSVSTGEGEAVLDVRFNNQPVVVGLTSSQSSLDVGQQSELTVLASDGDEDTLGYQWSASCEGTWEGAGTNTARFTPTALPAGTCNNCRVSVEVSDGRGGKTTGTLALCVAPSSAVQLPPLLVRSYQSSLSAKPSQLLTFEVVASDPAGGALSFAWSAAVGTLGTAVKSATSSRVTWTAPACVPAGASASLSATVTNGFGLTATRSFSVTGLPFCWTPTGSMASARHGHTATLLGNGKVLVVGGGQATAELYDPASRTWSSAGSLAAPRHRHTMTLLGNGKVLVTGGVSGGHALSEKHVLKTAEVYDPATNEWSSASDMNSQRHAHTATLLSDGKVLITGGMKSFRSAETAGTVLATAEVYDPATDDWFPIDDLMASPREAHTATLLGNGKVLVAGGRDDTDSGLASAELYDPASGTWSPAASMALPRRYFTATLLGNGQVLIAGGYNDSFAVYRQTQVYNPANDEWSPTSYMASQRFNHTAALLSSGKVLVSGGSYDLHIYNAAEVYDPATHTWSSAGTMCSPRKMATATLLSTGEVLVSGGIDYDSDSDSVSVHATAELYTP